VNDWDFVARASLRECADPLSQGQTRWSIPLSPQAPNPLLLTALARSIPAGEPSVEAIVARCGQTLGRKWRWLTPLARRYRENFENKLRPRRQEVLDFLARDQGLGRAFERYRKELSVDDWLVAPQEMRPVPSAAGWSIPAIESVKALADLLHLSVSELEWFADLKGLGSKSGSMKGTANGDSRLSHYHYRTVAKNSGTLRLIEAPKSHLKAIQRRILAEILDNIPIHPAAHGFVKGCSIKTFATPHAGRRVLLRMDLQDFFPSFAARRIQAIFRTAGYPESVADLLGGLCTNAAPRNIWRELGLEIDRSEITEALRLYSRPHLPQGTPTSPALANICSYRVDSRLNGLAQSCGATYTRYADDLAFSGDEAFEKCLPRFAIHAAAILAKEGFRVNHRKTRVMRQGVRQYLAGLVVNQHVNFVRDDFDRLKAILHNCIRYGPESQNREAHPRFQMHLAGRVGYVEMIHPARGEHLRKLFQQIQWK
jgi:retron-type reverse transcriptase